MNAFVKTVLIGLWLLSTSAGFARQGVRMPYFFGSDMVLQRQKPIQFWGTAEPKTSFSIGFANQKKTVRADASGKWQAVFPALEAGGPYEIKVISDSSYSFTNVLIGDVWLCSGQSNMQRKAMQTFHSAYELRNANLPAIRYFAVERQISSTPQTNVTPASWQVCTPENAALFSAVGFFFGRELNQSQQIPIGLINDAWGGTLIEPWISLESITRTPEFKGLADAFLQKKTGSESIEISQQTYARNLAAWTTKTEQLDQGYREGWHLPTYQSTNWKTLVAPGFWEDQSLPDYDGVVWLRKEINVPAALTGKPLVLNLEVLKDFDITYFNGVEVGRVTWVGGQRVYPIPAKLVKEGKNIIAIRVENNGGPGGFTSRTAADLRLQELIESEQPLVIPLAGDWQIRPSLTTEQYLPKPVEPTENRRLASSIHNAMIAPLATLGLKGILWYQGESNVGKAATYRKLLPLLIQDWRAQFKQGDLPFLIVQLAGHTALTPNPVDHPWAELREAQQAALQVPNTGLAVTIDVGNPYDVHPAYKKEVGQRLAAEAFRLVYGQNDRQTSPLFESMSKEGNSIRLKFRYAKNGLVAKNGPLKGFAIAGSDGKFVWANARISGNDVLVSHDQITNPVAVRYAWTGSPVESNGANLYNKDGFPAAPFRTDVEAVAGSDPNRRP